MKTKKEILSEIKTLKTFMKDLKKEKDWKGCATVAVMIQIFEGCLEVIKKDFDHESIIKIWERDQSRLCKEQIKCQNYYAADKHETSARILKWVLNK